MRRVAIALALAVLPSIAHTGENPESKRIRTTPNLPPKLTRRNKCPNCR